LIKIVVALPLMVADFVLMTLADPLPLVEGVEPALPPPYRLPLLVPLPQAAINNMIKIPVPMRKDRLMFIIMATSISSVRNGTKL
jgi:hypothetical protein